MFLIALNFAGLGASEACEKNFGRIYSSNYIFTVGADFSQKEMKIRDKSINFQIWDLAGHPREGTVRSEYFHGKKGIFIFFKKDNKQSFEDTRLWFEEFKIHNGKSINSFSKEQLVLLGIIEDIEVVTKEEGIKIAEELGMSYYELLPESSEPLNGILRKLGERYLDSVGIK